MKPLLQSRPMRKLASLMVPLQEDTTSANIAFLPSGFLPARKQLRSIGKYKTQWHVKMLETVDEAEFLFEDRMKMKVGKQHLEAFCKEVLNCSVTGFPKLVDLRHVINEGLKESLELRKQELDNLIRESVGLRRVQESAQKFLEVFGGRIQRSVVPSAVDLFDREIGLNKVLESIHGTLLTRGRAEMLLSAMSAGDVSQIAPDHSNLSSTSVVAECYGHKLVHTAAFGRDGVLRESVKVDSHLPEDFAVHQCKTLQESVHPAQGSEFAPTALHALKKVLKESDEVDERLDLIESVV